MKSEEEAWEEVLARRGAGGDEELAPDGGVLAREGLDDAVVRGDGVNGVGEEAASGGCRSRPALAAREEGHAEFGLEPLDVAADAGLADVALARRLPEASGAADGDEAAKRADVHASLLSSSFLWRPDGTALSAPLGHLPSGERGARFLLSQATGRTPSLPLWGISPRGRVGRDSCFRRNDGYALSPALPLGGRGNDAEL